MSYETLVVSREGPLGVVQLNRPEALNALNTKMVTELIEALSDFEKDDGVRCLVITGTERALDRKSVV